MARLVAGEMAVGVRGLVLYCLERWWSARLGLRVVVVVVGGGSCWQSWQMGPGGCAAAHGVEVQWKVTPWMGRAQVGVEQVVGRKTGVWWRVKWSRVTVCLG